MLFYIWEDPRVWAYGNHYFPVHLRAQGVVFHILSPLGAHVGSDCSPGGCWITGLSPSSVPLGSGTHVGGLQSLMTVTSLFTDMAGNIPIPSPSPWSGIRPTCGRHFMTIFVPQGWEAPPRLG